MITVDNGISSHAGVETATGVGDAGDYYRPPPDHQTNSIRRGGGRIPTTRLDFPSKALAGVGVAFYVLANCQFTSRSAGKRSNKVTQYLDLVALGTYADVATFDYNNRILVDAGRKDSAAPMSCRNS